MNIGLIILVTSLFVGAEDNNTDQPAEIKKLITNNKKRKLLQSLSRKNVKHLIKEKGMSSSPSLN